MARIRTIKPDFFSSLTIDKLSLTAQRTFIGSWCYVDDEGRGLDDSRLLKAAIWPLSTEHDSAKVESDLKEIAELGLIVRYEVHGRQYIQVTNWKEHQAVSHPRLSKYPQPPEDFRKDTGSFRSGMEGKGTGKGKEGKAHPLSGSEVSWEEFASRVSDALPANAQALSGWFPNACVLIARSFGYRRSDDPGTLALWWRTFRESSLEEVEEALASVVDLPPDKQPKGRADLRSMLARKIKERRPVARKTVEPPMPQSEVCKATFKEMEKQMGVKR